MRIDMDVAAPPQLVWGLIANCPEAPRFMSSMLSCRVLSRDGNAEVREQRLRGPLLKPVLREVFRAELDPGRSLTFQGVEGDWTRWEGRWLLTPLDGGRGVHVSLAMHASPRILAPEALVQAQVAKGQARAFDDLRAEALRRVDGSPPGR